MVCSTHQGADVGGQDNRVLMPDVQNIRLWVKKTTESGLYILLASTGKNDVDIVPLFVKFKRVFEV